MALASVGSKLSANDRNTANWATWTIATGLGAVSSGQVLLIKLATDNVTTTDGNTNDHTAVSAGGQAMTKLREFTNGNAAAAAGATVSEWILVVGTALVADDDVVVNLAGTAPGNGAKAATGWAFSKGAGTPLVVETGADKATDGVAPGSLALSGLPNREYLALRAIAVETSTAGLTPTASWTALSIATTAAGGAATNVNVCGEFRIQTTTSFTSNPTGVAAADTANVLVAIYEGTASTPIVGNESFALAEGAVAITINAGTITDEASVTDTAASSASVAASETLALAAETAAQVAQETKTGSDSVSLAEVVSALSATLATSDTPGVLEGSATLGLTVTSEAGTLSEVAGVAGSLSAVDAVGLTSELSALAWESGLADSLTLAEVSASVASVLSASEGVVFTDALVVTADLLRADNNAFADAAVVAEQALKAASDTATVAEQTDLLQAILLAANDSGLLNEALVASAALDRQDAEIAADSAAIVVTEFKAATEAGALGEQIVISAAITALETHALIETADQGGNLFLTGNDALLLSEAASYAAALTALESALMADAASAFESRAISASDAASANELLVLTANALLNDALLLAENSDVAGTIFKETVDSFGFVDVAETVQTVMLAVSDALVLTDTASLTSQQFISASDAATLSSSFATAADALAADSAEASEIALLSAVLAMRFDDAILTEGTDIHIATFVEMVGAIVTAAVTLRGMTTALADGPSGASSVQAVMTGEAEIA